MVVSRIEDAIEVPTCDCGAEMEPFLSGVLRTRPLVGKRVEYCLFSCPQCGDGCRYEKHDGEWTRL